MSTYTHIFLLLFCLWSSLAAQPYKTQSYELSTDNGKPFPKTTAITQDNKGYIWLATTEGLMRYNGQRLRFYDTLSQKIQTDRINVLLTYNDSIILSFGYNRIGGHTVINAINIETYEVRKISTDNQFRINQLDISSVQLNADQSVWFSSPHELYEYSNGKITSVLVVPDSQYIQHYKKTGANGWVVVYTESTKTSLWYIDKNGKKLEDVPITNAARVTYAVQLFHSDQEGQLYYSVTYPRGKEEMTVCYSKKPGQPAQEIHFSTGDHYRFQLYAAPYKQIWCTNHDGYIFCFDLQGNFIYKTDYIQNFEGKFLKRGFFDKQTGFWWVNDNIAKRLQLVKNPFEIYLVDAGLKMNLNIDKLKEFGARGITQTSSGDLIICGILGSFHLDKTGHLKNIIIPPIRKISKTMMTNSRLATYTEGDIVWITDERWTLIKYNTKTFGYETFTYPNPKVNEDILNWSIFRDQHNRLWLGHISGLSYLDEEKGELVLYDQYNGFDELRKSSVFYMHPNKDGIWLATTSGLYLLDPKKGIQKHFYKDEKNTLPFDNIAHIHEDKEGWFWLATKGGGLLHWNPKTFECKPFTKKNGLSDNTIYAVYEDDYGKLWMSSNNGIMSMDKKQLNVSQYNKYDGLPHQEFNTISHYKDAEGRLYFGSLNGVVSFHPKEFNKAAKNDIPLAFSAFLLYNEASGKFDDLSQLLTRDKKVRLAADVSLAEIQFSYLDFRNPFHNEYQYKIEGFHREWQQVYPAKFSIGGLPYDFYTISIRAKGPQGDWSTPVSIALNVEAPFYLRLEFLIASFFVLLTLVWLIVRWRTHRLRERQHELEMTVAKRTEQLKEQAEQLQEQTEQLKELDQLKSKFFANISHELRTPLTLILGPLSYIIDQPKNITKEVFEQLNTMQRNGKRLLQLIEEILDLAKMEAGKLELNESPIPISLFLEDISYNFQTQAKVLGLDFVLKNQLASDLHLLLDQQKVEKIISNLLSNAFKFTPAGGQVILAAYPIDSSLIFEVEDNGKGIRPNDQKYIFDRFYQTSDIGQRAEGGTGIGLALCKEYAQLMQGKIFMHSEWGQGSKFTVELPFKPTEGNMSYLTVKEEKETSEVMPHHTEEIPTGQPLLLVEDNPDMREFVSKLLGTRYKVQSCTNGKEALDLLTQTDFLPTLIVSDIMMPEMDGFELLKQLKAHKQFSNIPVVMLTARAAEQDKLKALRIGVDDYLIKPFSAQELLTRVNNLVQNANLRYQFSPELEQPPVDSTPEEEEEEQLPERNQLWLEELEQVARKAAEDTDFDPNKLAEFVSMSRSTLYRKMKKLTGLTPSQYLKEIRLQMGREALERGTHHNITEVCYAIGFGTPYYFTKEYEKRFGRKVTSYFE